MQISYDQKSMQQQKPNLLNKIDKYDFYEN